MNMNKETVLPFYQSKLKSICLTVTKLYVGFTVLTMLSMKSMVFWVVTMCPLEKAQRFGGTYCSHLQGQRISKQKNSMQVTSLILDPKDRSNMFL
jgi:hypothetical protein